MRLFSRAVRRGFFHLALGLLTVFAATAAHASSDNWIEPTPAERQMTAEPKAPGAAAIILSYDESDDANSAEVQVHVRIKVLTEGGLSAGTVNVPDRVVLNDSFDQVFYARTIHPDGTIVMFAGTPEDSKTVDSFYGSRKVISLPAVTVGSILEYGYHFASQNTYFSHLIGYYSPTWRVQQPYFVCAAHFSLKAPQERRDHNPWLPSYDQNSVRWVANLPKGAAVSRNKSLFELNLQDIPAAAVEEYMPPPASAFYNVRFFYYTGQQDRYWGESGDRVDAEWIDFDQPTKLLKDAVRDLVLPADNDETKLRKLYQAVQAMENTDLTREHSKHEEKVAGQRTKGNADAIWTNKRGDSEELTLLFVALARAAGYQAYPMAVASRDHALFDQNVLSWNQMDAMVAIVNLNGHEHFFDPGTPLCPFNHVAPSHSNVTGVSTEAKLVKIRLTPAEQFRSDLTDRTAELTLSADGGVNGTVRIAWTGTAGLAMRRDALRRDAHAAETAAEKRLQAEVPEGVEVKLVSLTGLNDSEAPLVGTFSVSGHLGTATSKRLIVPAQFFAASAKPLLASETRTQPVAFPSSYALRDKVILHVPSGLTVESLPPGGSANLGKDTAYVAAEKPSQQDPQVLATERTFILNRIDFKVDEYPTLRKYFGQLAGFDADQIILKTADGIAKTSGN